MYAGAIFDALRRISFTVATSSRTPRFHLCACMKSSADAGPGMRSEVGAGLDFLSQGLATRGLGFAPRSGLAGPMPNRFLVCSSDFADLSLASCFFRYSDFTAQYLGNGLAFLNGVNARLSPPQLLLVKTWLRSLLGSVATLHIFQACARAQQSGKHTQPQVPASSRHQSHPTGP